MSRYYVGTEYDDYIVGRAGRKTTVSFYMSQGGDDTVFGAGRQSYFFYGDTFDQNDSVTGTSGIDRLLIDVPYKDTSISEWSSVIGVEEISVGGTGSYTLSGDMPFTSIGTYGASLHVDHTTSEFQAALIGGSADDYLTAGVYGDTLYGHGGSDTLVGGTLSTLEGGDGADRLISGEGATRFAFEGGDSSRQMPDTIRGYHEGDLIIITGDRDLAFPHLADKDVPRELGDVVVTYNRTGTVTKVAAYLGDRHQADIFVKIAGHHDLTASDFLFFSHGDPLGCRPIAQLGRGHLEANAIDYALLTFGHVVLA